MTDCRSCLLSYVILRRTTSLPMPKDFVTIFGELAERCSKWRYAFSKKNLVPTQSKFKLGLSVQITFCIFICCFFLSLHYVTSLYIYIRKHSDVGPFVSVYTLFTDTKKKQFLHTRCNRKFLNRLTNKKGVPGS